MPKDNRGYGTTCSDNSSTSIKTTTRGRGRDRYGKLVDYTERGKVISKAESFGLQEYLRTTMMTTSSTSSSIYKKERRRRSTSRSFPKKESNSSSSKVRLDRRLDSKYASRVTILERKKSTLRRNGSTTNPATLRPQRLCSKSWSTFRGEKKDLSNTLSLSSLQNKSFENKSFVYLEALDLDLKKRKKLASPLVVSKDITDFLSDMSYKHLKQSSNSTNSSNNKIVQEKRYGYINEKHIQFFLKIPARKDRLHRSSDLWEKYFRPGSFSLSSPRQHTSRSRIRSILMVRDLSFKSRRY